MSVELSRSLRADAADNRDRILEAAAELFAADGLSVPMREVARLAGVGPATLYRHFPTKQDLAAATFAAQVRLCRSIVDAGAAEPDPWTGLCLVIERICEVNSHNRGFTEALLATYPTVADLKTDREYTLGVVAKLARRAKTTGRLRPDFTIDDLIIMLSAHRAIPGTTPRARRAASRRFAALTIDALRAA